MGFTNFKSFVCQSRDATQTDCLIQGLEFQVEWVRLAVLTVDVNISWYAQRLQGEHGLRSWTGAEAGIGRP